MNLFELLSNFLRVNEQKNFTRNKSRLFFSESFGESLVLSKWVEFADKRMVANANISLQVLKSARERLKEAEQLNYAHGVGYRLKPSVRF